MGPTLADVARLSSTSRSTASRALRNDPRISPETAQRVFLVAQALKYRPNLAARSLSTGRSGVIGLVVPSQQLTGDPYGSKIVSSVSNAAVHSDQAVMLWVSHERPGQTVQRMLSGGLLDGVVISIIAQADLWVDDLIASGLPCVLIGRHSGRPNVSFASIDNIGGTHELMVHLLAQGYQRIAIIRGPLDNADADERLTAYREALEASPLGYDANLVALGDYSYDGGHRATQDLLRHRPDCIVAANDLSALGAIDAAKAAGLSVPGDVAVAGWDDLTELHRPSVPLTTVRQDVEAVGETAVSILLELLEGAPGPIQRVLPTSLVVRDSTLRKPEGRRSRGRPKGADDR